MCEGAGMNGDDDADDGNGNDDSHDNGDDYYDEDAADNDDADEADDADDDDGDGDEDDDGDFLFYYAFLAMIVYVVCEGAAHGADMIYIYIYGADDYDDDDDDDDDDDYVDGECDGDEDDDGFSQLYTIYCTLSTGRLMTTPRTRWAPRGEAGVRPSVVVPPHQCSGNGP